mgnify:CR=1 FL=1
MVFEAPREHAFWLVFLIKSYEKLMENHESMRGPTPIVPGRFPESFPYQLNFQEKSLMHAGWGNTPLIRIEQEKG